MTVTNFRGIERGVISGLADVNVIVGRNNSGKSTMMEMLVRASAGISGKQAEVSGRARSEFWGGSRQEGHGGVHAHLWFRNGTYRHLSAVLKLNGIDLDFSVNFSPGEFVPRLTSPAVEMVSKHCIDFLGNGTAFLPQLSSQLQIHSDVWKKSLALRADKEIVAILSELLQTKVEQLHFLPDGTYMVLYPLFGIPLTSEGDGVRCAVPCLTYLSLLERTFFIIEEPESHQHPGSIRSLGTAVCRMAANRAVQLFVTTHSTEAVRAFLQGAKESGSEAAVYHFHLADGQFDARRIEQATFGSLDAAGTDVRFLDLYA